MVTFTFKGKRVVIESDAMTPECALLSGSAKFRVSISMEEYKSISSVLSDEGIAQAVYSALKGDNYHGLHIHVIRKLSYAS